MLSCQAHMTMMVTRGKGTCCHQDPMMMMAMGYGLCYLLGQTTTMVGS